MRKEPNPPPASNQTRKPPTHTTPKPYDHAIVFGCQLAQPPQERLDRAWKKDLIVYYKEKKTSLKKDFKRGEITKAEYKEKMKTEKDHYRYELSEYKRMNRMKKFLGWWAE